MNYDEIDYLIASDLKVVGDRFINQTKVSLIRACGFTEAIEVDRYNNVINGQEWLDAAMSIGYLTVPCVVVNK